MELLVAEREAMKARLRAGDEVLDETLAQLDVPEAEAEMARMRDCWFGWRPVRGACIPLVR